MSETRSIRPSLLFAVAAVVVAAAVWATVAMAASGGSGSGSNGAPSPVASYDYGGPPAMFAADGDHAAGDCPNMGGDSGGSGGSGGSGDSTTPSTPSTQDGSSNPSL
jgi:hypothetical protein